MNRASYVWATYDLTAVQWTLSCYIIVLSTCLSLSVDYTVTHTVTAPHSIRYRPHTNVVWVEDRVTIQFQHNTNFLSFVWNRAELDCHGPGYSTPSHIHAPAISHAPAIPMLQPYPCFLTHSRVQCTHVINPRGHPPDRQRSTAQERNQPVQDQNQIGNQSGHQWIEHLPIYLLLTS